MTQKQIDILKSIEQEFNRINEQEVVDNNDLIAQIENRVDSKRKLRLELGVVDTVNKLAVEAVKNSIVDKLIPVVRKYGFNLEVNDCGHSGNVCYGVRVVCNGCKDSDGRTILVEGWVRGVWTSEDGIVYIKSPIPKFERDYCRDSIASEDALVSHFVDGIVKALKTKV
jgi:hypothetical protein